ncbi:hypothetical protein ACWGQ5_54790 [Streptomyces sp. NPDC055722]
MTAVVEGRAHTSEQEGAFRMRQRAQQRAARRRLTHQVAGAAPFTSPPTAP